MKWSTLGLRSHQPQWLQERIGATNSVFAILIIVLTLLLINSFAFVTPVMTWFMLISMLILFATLIVHAAGLNRISRVLVSILPVLVSSCIQGAYQMKGELPNASGWVFIAAFQVLPFLLFAPNEKLLRFISISINLSTSASYELFNDWIELPEAPFTPPVQVLITNMIGLMMMMRLLYTIDSLYVRSNRANQKLIEKVEKEREEQAAAKIELDKTIAALNASRAQEEIRSWLTKGVAEAAKILRDDDDMNKMLDKLMSFMVKYVGANQGGIFLVKQDEGSSYLELTACYAYERKRFLTKRVEFGEGLVGQCYYERHSIFMTDVPQNYVRITSGLGLATPNAILVVPMLHNGKVYGVMEFASFFKFEPHHMQFLEEVAETIAIAFNAIVSNEKTKALLQETQMMAEQMKAQDEAMRQNMEEIAATQEEQQRVENELRQIIEQQQQEIESLKGTLMHSEISASTLDNH